MSIFDKMQKIHRGFIYSGTIILTALVFFSGIPPVTVGAIDSWIYKTYNFIDQLGPDDTIVVWADNPSAYMIGHLPGFIAMFHQLVEQGTKVIFAALEPDGPVLVKMFMIKEVAPTMKKYGYVYGEDWTDFGYIAGGESAVAAFNANLRIKGVDYYGTPIEQLEVMNNINSLNDIKAVIVLTGYSQGTHMRQAYQKYGTPVIVVGFEGAATSWPIYLEAGTMYSFVHGWVGGAQYEMLVNKPGMATKGLNAMSLLWFVPLFLLLIGNIGYFGKKFSGGA